MRSTLVILAAGSGRRFGGPKQLEPIGPGGRTLLEYSAHDAIRAGFGRIVLVVRADAEERFRERLTDMARQVEIAYVHQKPRDASAEAKPWGTGEAVLATAPEILGPGSAGPFAVANADDFYGAESFAAISGFLTRSDAGGGRTLAMVGFELARTLPERGTVSRALCRLGDDGSLSEIVECKEIWRDEEGLFGRDPRGRELSLAGSELVSMNLWAFPSSFLADLAGSFEDFRRRFAGSDEAELQLPDVVGSLVASGRVRVEVLSGAGRWCGITRREDRDAAARTIAELTAAGAYPEDLWK